VALINGWPSIINRPPMASILPENLTAIQKAFDNYPFSIANFPPDPMGFRLGISITPKAIGWCLVELDATGSAASIRDLGTRVFSPNDAAGRDPATGEPLGAQRREARRSRRRYKHLRQRKQQLMSLLIGAGLMPSDEAARKQLELRDPYELRARAVHEALSPHEVGRALFHLGRRRGFRPARADARDSRSGVRYEAAARLETAIENAGAPTVGAFLAGLHRHNQANRQGETRPVRFRPRGEGEGSLWTARRDMTEAELVTIWAEQRRHRPEVFTDELFDRLSSVLLHQRPSGRAPVGRCRIRPEDEQAPRGLPSVELFELLFKLALLELDRGAVGCRRLRVEERDRLRRLIEERRGTVGFPAMRKLLGISDGYRFTAERQGVRGIDPPRLTQKLAAITGPRWQSMSLDERDELAALLIGADENEDLRDRLRAQYSWLDEDQRAELAKLPLPGGHSAFGRGAIGVLLPLLETGTTEIMDPEAGRCSTSPITPDEAMAQLGWATDAHPERHSRLPPYWDVAALQGSLVNGRVRDPSLHIALGQLRHVVNAIIDAHGRPEGIVVEIDRELKLSRKALLKQKSAVRKAGKDEADHEEWLRSNGLPDSWEHRLRLRLYDELPENRKLCVYSGRTLDRASLFDGTVVIDHILPMAQTLDDSLANKVLCCRSAWEDKRGRLVTDAFNDPSGARLREIIARADALLPGKAWRFRPDALTRLGKSGDPLQRHLADRQHVSRTVRTYLEAICPFPATAASTGRLRRWLRHGWGISGLPERECWGLREHAADATIAACLDSRTLEGLAALFHGGTTATVPEPFSGFSAQLQDKLTFMIVSHRPDRSASGPLHRDTAFGRADDEIDGKRFALVTRKPVSALTGRDVVRVRDPALRERLKAARACGETLAGIRHVRVLDLGEAITVRHGPDGRFEKAFQPHGNHCVSIFERTDERWEGQAVTLFEAVQSQAIRNRAEHRRPVMRLYKGDMLRLREEDGALTFWVVRKLDPANNRVGLVAHDRIGPFPSTAYRQVSYNGLKALKVGLAGVSILGKVSRR